MKTLPVTVLIHDGPMARAYLARLSLAGWRPQRAILMVQSHRRPSGKPIGAFLPDRLRRWYCEVTQEVTNNDWPRRIKRSLPWLVDAIAAELAQLGDAAALLIDDIVSRFDYANSVDEFERVFVRGFRDPRLRKAFASSDPRCVLFTGGGIVPESLLSLPQLSFLHIHPGYLPHVRGADGLLWSMLVRSRPGVSCFTMAPGIDTGDVLAADDFPPLRFDITGHPRPEDQMLYRAIFSFYDPILRAEFLARTVAACDGDIATLSAHPQSNSSSVTYHFMHDSLRRIMLKDLFRS